MDGGCRSGHGPRFFSASLSALVCALASPRLGARLCRPRSGAGEDSSANGTGRAVFTIGLHRSVGAALRILIASSGARQPGEMSAQSRSRAFLCDQRVCSACDQFPLHRAGACCLQPGFSAPAVTIMAEIRASIFSIALSEIRRTGALALRLAAGPIARSGRRRHPGTRRRCPARSRAQDGRARRNGQLQAQDGRGRGD